METTLRRDLVAIDDNEDTLEALIANLYQGRGDLKLYPRNFEGATRGQSILCNAVYDDPRLAFARF